MFNKIKLLYELQRTVDVLGETVVSDRREAVAAHRAFVERCDVVNDMFGDVWGELADQSQILEQKALGTALDNKVRLDNLEDSHHLSTKASSDMRNRMVDRIHALEVKLDRQADEFDMWLAGVATLGLLGLTIGLAAILWS